jgi:hypothetical protein
MTSPNTRRRDSTLDVFELMEMGWGALPLLRDEIVADLIDEPKDLLPWWYETLPRDEGDGLGLD